MKEEVARSGYSIKVSGFSTDKVIEYSLMEDYNSFKNFVKIANQQKINIKKNDNVLIIRYQCDNTHDEIPDGFEVEPVTGKVNLLPHQFSTREDDNGELWTYCVFQITTILSKEDAPPPDHDSDVKPPVPPIP
jgi:hypothetical protein